MYILLYSSRCLRWWLSSRDISYRSFFNVNSSTPSLLLHFSTLDTRLHGIQRLSLNHVLNGLSVTAAWFWVLDDFFGGCETPLPAVREWPYRQGTM